MKEVNQLENLTLQEKVDKLNAFLEISNGFSVSKSYNLSELYHLKSIYITKKGCLKQKLVELSKVEDKPEELLFYRDMMLFVLDFLKKETNRAVLAKKERQKLQTQYEKSKKKVRDPGVNFEEESLDKKQISLIGKIINREKIVKYSWEDLIYSYQQVIRNYPVRENEEAILEGVSKILDSNLEQEVKSNYLVSIYDYLNNRRKRLGKDGEEEEKTKIRNIMNLIETNLVILQKDTLTKKDILNQQVTEYLLENATPYYYIKKLFELEPSLLRTRKDGKHISVFVLEHYIESQKEELRNHKKYYIPKEYYKTLLQLFFENKISDIRREDYETLDNLKEEFISYLEVHKYKDENKQEALNQLEWLFQENKINVPSLGTEIELYLKTLKDRNKALYYDNKRVCLTEGYIAFNRQKVNDFITRYYEENHGYPDEEVILNALSMTKVDFQNATLDSCFIPTSTPYCNFVVLQNNDGSCDLKINVLDLTYYVGEGDILDSALQKSSLFDISRFLKSNGIQQMPSITYQFRIHANSSMGPLKIYRSIVPVFREKIDYSDYREDERAKKLVSVYRKLNDGGEVVVTQSLLENLFFDLLEQRVCRLAFGKKIPIILKGTSDNVEEDIYSIQNGLGNLFGKMEKQDFKSYGMLFGQVLDEVHYTNDAYEKGDFSLSLIHPTNLVDLFNQRLLLKIENLSKLNDSGRKLFLEDYKMVSDNIVENANLQIGYIKDVGYQKVKKQQKK